MSDRILKGPSVTAALTPKEMSIVAVAPVVSVNLPQRRYDRRGICSGGVILENPDVDSACT